MQLAYISRREFKTGIAAVNDEAIDGLIDYMLKLKLFEKLSRGLLKKIIKTSRLVNLPWGWKYNSDKLEKYLFHILKGSVNFEFANHVAQTEP